MTTPKPPPPRPRPATALAAAILLAALVVAAFWPTLRNGWVDWDDAENYLANFHYRGLGPDQLLWAATTYHVGVYQPMSWVVCGAEYLLFGMDARGYHLFSLILHAVNSGLLFVLVRRLVSRGRPDLRAEAPGLLDLGALLATALFAVHPLRVEVVAWNSCQQYLLATFFSILAVLAYLRADPGRRRHAGAWLAASWCLLMLGILSKAAAIGVAAALVVLDAYPLRRLGGGPGRWLGPRALWVWAEKVPFAAMAAYFSVLAVRAKNHNHTLMSISEYGLAPRGASELQRVLLSLQDVPADGPLHQLLPARPLRLVSVARVADDPRVPARHRGHGDRLEERHAGVGGVLGGVHRASGQLRRGAGSATSTPPIATATSPRSPGGAPGRRLRDPGPATGPEGGPGRRRRGPGRRALGPLAAADPDLVRLGEPGHPGPGQPCVPAARGPDCPGPDPRGGERAQAEALYREALRLDPRCRPAHVSLGLLRLDQDKVPEAVAEFSEAVRLRPNEAEPHNNLGAALGRLGRLDDAVAEFSEALRLEPNFAPARANLLKAAAARERPNSVTPPSSSEESHVPEPSPGDGEGDGGNQRLVLLCRR